MQLIFLSYFPAVVGLCLLGLVTYINNPASRVNRLFTIFVGLVASWLLALFLADTATSDTSALWFLRLALAIGSLLGYAFLVFCDSFPSPHLQKLSQRTRAVLGALTAAFVILSFTNLMAPSVTRTDSGVMLDLTTVYSLQTLFLLVEIIAGIVLIQRRRKRVFAAQRNQIRLFTIGTVVAIAINSIPGFVFILLDISSSLTALLTSTSFFAFAVFVWLSITRHSMFNIRNVVARTVAYTLSALIVSVVYTMLIGVIVDNYIESRPLAVTLTGVSALFAVVSFSKIKTLFDRMTNKLFYREAYSSREKLDLLTNGLVSHIELEKLARDSMSVIRGALRPQRLSLRINTENDADVFGAKFRIDSETLERIIASANGEPLITNNVQGAQADRLRKAGIELIVPIRSAHVYEGSIILGPRESGEVYSYQDVSFLKIAARNIGLAMNNAKSYQQITEFNKTLQTKIQKATRELRTKNRELEDLHKTKDDFISMASHQLRPKIAASQGFLDLLNRTGLKKTKEQAELLNLALEGIHRISDVVVDMLDISRMDADQMILDYGITPTDLVTLVTEEISALEGGKKSKQITLQQKPKPAKIQAHIDKIKIREVIVNLLSNAKQYSPENTPIAVEITRTDNSVKIIVIDKGFGMTKSELGKLFEKFYRSEAARTIRPTGSGVGLYVSKKIVEAHGGSMVVSSQKGKGSSIGFTLPLNF